MTQVHLILDEHSVAESRGVTFHLNPATKHPENPVLLPGEPHEWDSLQVSWPGTVLYSPRDRKFGCWYLGLDVVQTPERFWKCGYAESDDGVHWTKPKLKHATFLDRPTNMILPGWPRPSDPRLPWWSPHFLNLVFENPDPNAPPEQRFGSYWSNGLIGADGKFTERRVLAWSPDGIEWHEGGTAYQIHPYDRFRWHDINQVLHDPDDPDPEFRVKAYSQYFRARAYDGREKVRHIGMLHGRGVEHVESLPDPVIFGPEPGIDEEIHYASVKKIGAQYLMLFESDRFNRSQPHGDLRLAVSATGRPFRRIHPHTPLVATGAKGMWDENLIVTSNGGIQEVGDEFYLFYFGCPGTYRAWPAQYEVMKGRGGFMFAPVSLGLATLPRDRFAHATGDGSLTTHPLELTAEGVWLNADGDPQVAAFVEPGKLTARGKLTNRRLQGVYRKVGWAGLAPMGKNRLEIMLTSQDNLFSIAC